MSQEPLGRHHDQWLAPRPQDLPPQEMKELRWRAGVANLDAVFRSEGKKTFQARAGMLGSLPFEAMGQEQPDPREPPPFVLCAHDELIDDDLRGVRKIAKLSFPQDQ